MSDSALNLWENILEHEDDLRLKRAPESISTDIEYLENLGTCDRLLELARHKTDLYASLKINWALGAELRLKHKALFSHGAVIARDSDFNLVVWQDVRDENSKIICLTEAPKTAIILAETVTEWLTELRNILSNADTKATKRQFWNSYLKAHKLEELSKQIANEKTVGSSFEITTKNNQASINFANAQVGHGISLKYMGRHTLPEISSHDTGLVLTRRSDDEIRKIETRERYIKIGIAVTLIGSISTYLISGDDIPTALVKGFSLTLGLIFLGLTYRSWKIEAQNDKSLPSVEKHLKNEALA